MIKTPLSTVIGGAFWTPGATILGSASKTLNQLIKSIFANNEQGFVYDPNDLTTMFQDAAGAIPVTGAGQPVGLILDKSGRGNHARQANSTSRPILQRNATTGAYYLAFDGADDFFVTNSIDFTSTDKVSLFAGVRKLSDSAQNMIVEFSTSANTDSNSFALTTYPASGELFTFASRGTGLLRVAAIKDLQFSAPKSAVLTGIADFSAQTISLKANSVLVTNSLSTTGAFGNYPLYIGRRGGTSLPFNGHIYSLIGIGRLTTDAETATLEKLIAKNTGVTLSV